MIPLTKGQTAVVDDEDYAWLVAYSSWCCKGKGIPERPFYAMGWNKATQKTVLMHRVIMRPAAHLQVDHANGDGLDNRRVNLRICDAPKNVANHFKHHVGASGFKGVRQASKWQKGVGWRGYGYVARVGDEYVGYFKDARDAARAYDDALIRLHGEFARTNKMLGLLC